MDIPSLFMIPSAVSSGKVHSVFPNSTDADFQFNRDSDATRVNSEGLIERVGYYGSELITNGDFSNGYVGWSLSGNPSNYSVEVVDYAGRTNALHFTTTGANEGINQNVLQSSTTYYVRFDLKVISGSVYVGKNSARVTNADLSPSEWTTYAVNWTSADTYFRVYSATVGAEFYVDNISVKEVTGDRARLNYEIEGGLVNTKPSLLLEPQSTNSLTYSNDFANSYWTKSNTSISSNVIVSPDGASNASELIEDTSNSTHQITRSITNVTSNQYSISVFAKANTRNWIRLSSGDGGFVFFNLADNLIGTQTNATGVIKDMGNGWRRCEITFTALGTSGSATVRIAESNGVTSYVGQNKSVYLYGMQYEQLSYSTSYIPTNGSTQTRAAETCNGAGTSSILPSEEGILYVDIACLNDTGSYQSISISDGTANNRVAIENRPISNQIKVFVVVGGTTIMSSTQTLTDVQSFNKMAIKWKQNDFSWFVNGVKIYTDLNGNTPTGLNEVAFERGGSGQNFVGKIRDIRVYNTKEMTDSEVDILLTKITS